MKHFLFSLILILLSGCSLGLHTSHQAVRLNSDWQNTITDDFVKVVKKSFGTDKVFVVSTTSLFGETLERKLRNAGYGVSTNATESAQEIVYTVDSLSPDLLVVSLHVGTGWRASKVYSTSTATLKSASAFTIQS